MQNVAVVLATGVNAEGKREVLGVDVITTEDGAGWTAFLRGLVARGWKGPKTGAALAPRCASGPSGDPPVVRPADAGLAVTSAVRASGPLLWNSGWVLGCRFRRPTRTRG